MAMPLFHLSAAPTVLAPMLVGGTSVLAPAFHPTEMWDEIRACGAAGFAGAGAMVSMVWNLPPDPSGARGEQRIAPLALSAQAREHARVQFGHDREEHRAPGAI